MSQTFEEMLNNQFSGDNMRRGAIIPATIIRIDSNVVELDAGLKSEALIYLDEFKDESGEVNVKEGDVVDVVVESAENGYGEPQLSRRKAIHMRIWKRLDEAHEKAETVIGVITERVKGGFTVTLDGVVRAFLPGSLLDVRPVRDPSYLEHKELEFKVIKMDRRRNNIVVSRRAIVEEETSSERQALLDNLSEGMELKGVVKNITDYGAFIDLGGIDGLLHITDMAWQRVKHPSELFKVGDEVDVKVLKYDAEKRRVSLGIKQLGEDPLRAIADRFPVGTRIKGTVTNLVDYGCFVEIEPGIEGLVHMSEMDWTNKNVHPGKIVQVGDEVEVQVLEIDEDRRRVSLGIKQCKMNPWEKFAEEHKKGERLVGKIRSITDFGIFIGLEGDIDGLVHLSDISWTETGEVAVRDFKKGQEIETIIMSIDPERERISLGVKQIDGGPLHDYIESHPKGSKVDGVVVEIESKQATIRLQDEIMGFLRNVDMGQRVSDMNDYLVKGEEIEVIIKGIDRKSQMIMLTLTGLVEQAADTIGDDVPGAKLGDFFKQQGDSDGA